MSVGFRSGYNNASIAAIKQLVPPPPGPGHVPGVHGPRLRRRHRPRGRLDGPYLRLGNSRPHLRRSESSWWSLPLSFLVKRSPEDPWACCPTATFLPPHLEARLHDGSRQANGEPSGRSRSRVRWALPENDFTAREAMRTPSYWMLVLAAGLRNTAHSGLSFLLAPVMVWFLQQGGREQIESLQIAAFFVGAGGLRDRVLQSR